jgi:tetratricopeptide (TPR) repeat protein
MTLVLMGCQREASPPHSHEPAEGKVPLFDDLGTYTHPVTTTVPLAQRYFDQGLRLAYGFNHDEAKRAFEEAARLDPKCAMAWWGVALVLGPNINLPTDPAREMEAMEAVGKAKALAGGASDVERGYIDAIAKRYSTDTRMERTAKDQGYADAMRDLAKRYPNDLDAATLFAEALMDLHPWDLWTLDGKPKWDVEEIVSTLEGVLKTNPKHPGANHLYIHAVEASPSPERALSSAERFTSGLVPGAGHLVHMPAHVYMRTGRYADAVEANARAAALDKSYIAKEKVQGVYPMIYYNHNLQFLAAAAAMDGRSETAIRTARELVGEVHVEMVKEMPMVEMVVPTSLWMMTRFGKWDEILADPAPHAALSYTTGMWHYARGMALTRKGKPEEAAKELEQLRGIAGKLPPDLMMNLNSAVSLLAIASDVLAGEMAAARGRHVKAVDLLEKAIRGEDALRYDEPPAWYYPVRQSLGAVLLAAKRTSDAEAVYREDLRRNPENGWSLFGLVQCLEARGAKDEAAATRRRFEAAWSRADVKLTASRF